MAIASRILPTGTFLVNNSLDEVSYSLNGTTGAYTYNNGVSTATNKYLYSQDFSQTSFWSLGSSSTFTQNTVIAPDGSLTAATWTGSTGTPYFAGQSSIVTSTIYTFSIYMKAGTQTRAGILLYGTHFNSGGANGFPVWDLSTGALVSSAPPAFITAYGIQAVGNGWYRVYVTATATTTASTNQQIARMQDGFYTLGNYMYLWGAQFEVAASTTSLPTAYVGTGATTSININNFAQRIIASGVEYVSGSFDEVSYNPNGGTGQIGFNGVSTTTNLLTYSQDFTNWSKNASPNDYTVSADSTVAPDGSTTADLIIKGTTAGTSSICYKIFTGAINTAYCGSIYVKAGGYSKVKVKFGGTAFNSIDTGGTFDLAAGTTNTILNGSTVTITSVGNGWYRITVTATSDADGGNYNFSMTPQNATYNEAFAGDGTSGIYLWGAQVELGSAATTYVATGATTSININNFARRELNTGLEYVSGEFDEVTWNPPIITSGLVLNVDASVPTSYNGTGTTLTDLSSSGLNGTLSSSALPYTRSGVAGYFNFNSTYNIAFPVSTTLNFEGVLPFSFNIWTNPQIDPGPNNYYTFYSRDANPGTGRSGYTLWITQDLVTPTNIKIGTERYASGVQSGGYAVSIVSSGFLGTWNMFTVTYDGSNLRLYRNAVLQGTSSGATGSIVNNVTPLSINTANQNRQYMGQLLAYNTTLSLADIKQNYNATCYRYGLSPI
jgi:hypothetical protein